MNKLAALVGGIGAGAATMYLFDPRQGRRRRALLRDRAYHFARQAGCAIQVAGEDMQNRIVGIAAAGKSKISGKSAGDDIVCERIRSKLGRYVSHPRAIEVTVHDGCVKLGGQILGNEMPTLLAGLRGVQGIKEIDNKLEVHQSPAESPRLQGGTERFGEHFDFFQKKWAPATRAIVGGSGCAMVLYGFKQSGIIGALAGAFGCYCIAEAVSNKELSQLFGQQNSQAQRARAGESQMKQRAQQPQIRQRVEQPTVTIQQEETISYSSDPNLI